ncbi:transposase [Patulibacter defluvii]|uniref:transposase n=1 Tax=Patulibacter defluvii TaxID=3095358 RepID=UPI002A76229A|nr:transposase [Patulibacter sp. DM4]
MGRGRQYPQELKDRAIRLCLESERPIAQIAGELDINKETLRTWVRQEQADQAGGAGGAVTSAEREELARLRRENKDLKRSNEILKAASVFFAKELDQPRTK